MLTKNRPLVGVLILLGILLGSFFLGKVVLPRNERHKVFENTLSRPVMEDYQI